MSAFPESHFRSHMIENLLRHGEGRSQYDFAEMSTEDLQSLFQQKVINAPITEDGPEYKLDMELIQGIRDGVIAGMHSQSERIQELDADIKEYQEYILEIQDTLKEERRASAAKDRTIRWQKAALVGLGTLLAAVFYSHYQGRFESAKCAEAISNLVFQRDEAMANWKTCLNSLDIFQAAKA